jgi:hypothetical protein
MCDCVVGSWASQFMAGIMVMRLEEEGSLVVVATMRDRS